MRDLGDDAGASIPRGFRGRTAEAMDALHPSLRASRVRECLQFDGARAGEQFNFGSVSALYYVCNISPQQRIGFTLNSLRELPDRQHSNK